MNKISIPFGRISIFIIYFWFGLLKVVGKSPASSMIEDLFDLTAHKLMPSLSFETFIIAFGIFEMLIGVLFLIPRLQKLAFVLLVIHLVTTALPLFVIGGMTWTKSLVPTLEGQYIIKNLAILGLGIFIVSRNTSSPR